MYNRCTNTDIYTITKIQTLCIPYLYMIYEYTITPISIKNVAWYDILSVDNRSYVTLILIHILL